MFITLVYSRTAFYSLFSWCVSHSEYSAASLPSHTCAICPGLQTSPISASDKLLPGSVVQVDGSSSAEVLSTTNVAALHKRIAELEDKLQSHKRRLSVCQRQKNAAVQEKNLLKRRVDQFLGTDQLQCMERPTMRGTPWSTPTIEKGLKIRLTCGRRGYNIVQEIGTPLPSERTLQRHLENFKFSPGILHEILPSLSIKVDLMEDYERHAVLLLDEMQLASGLAYDQGTGGVIGKPTIPLSDGTLPEDAMATHGLVFMLAGVTTRWKQTVAYHFTSNSFCSATVKAVVIDIIKKCEDIGIKIDAVVCDMGGGNQALWKEFGIVVGRYCHNKMGGFPSFIPRLITPSLAEDCTGRSSCGTLALWVVCTRTHRRECIITGAHLRAETTTPSTTTKTTPVPTKRPEAFIFCTVSAFSESGTHEVFQSHFCDYFVYTHVLPYQNDILAYDSNQSWERFKKSATAYRDKLDYTGFPNVTNTSTVKLHHYGYSFAADDLTWLKSQLSSVSAKVKQLHQENGLLTAGLAYYQRANVAKDTNLGIIKNIITSIDGMLDKAQDKNTTILKTTFLAVKLNGLTASAPNDVAALQELKGVA
ncbi:uncharacterized protein LOC125945694 [Dermacentor silvarum]|uniref:uncharacterized protein LOC125945694 n=1 Tax=Dermacentor silvarum TaxID=543639 RepID=UPI0021014793|nr:uncharacterized protein LOC125945694 [Dermacentor silvarum]